MLISSIKAIEITQNVFVANLFAPRQETFADTDDGDDGERGGVGNIWDPLRIIYNSF